MKALTVINGAADRKLSECIDQYTQLSGFRTYHVEDSVKKDRYLSGDILYTDREGADIYQEMLAQVWKDGYPVVIIPISFNDAVLVRKYRKCITARSGYPFTYKDFIKITAECLEDEQMAERDLVYGDLLIDREQRLVIYQGKEVPLGPYEFDVLVYLLAHVGRAVSREDVNRILPERKRENGRNIDTHIKIIAQRYEICMKAKTIFSNKLLIIPTYKDNKIACIYDKHLKSND